MGPVTESAAVLAKGGNESPPPPPSLPPGAALKYLSEITVLGKQGATKGPVAAGAANFLDPTIAHRAKQFAAQGQAGAQQTPVALTKKAPQTLADLSRAGQKAHPAPKRLPAKVAKRAAVLFPGFTQKPAQSSGKRLVGRRVLAKTDAKKIPVSHPYVNPFIHSKSAIQTRTDMGIDYGGAGPISAIGKAKILSITSGFGGQYGTQGVLYKLLEGPKAGKNVYIYEGVQPTVQPGQIVAKGQQVGTFTGGIETGWASDTGATIASLHPATLAPDSSSQGGHFAPAGAHFQDFLHTIGGATPSSILDPSAQGLAAKAQRAGRNPDPAFPAGGTAAPPLTSPQVQHAVSAVLAKAGYRNNPRAAAVAKASIKYGRSYGVSPALITAISKVESGMGTSTLPGVRSGQNAYGAAGPMQMGNGTGASGNAWQTYSQQIWGAKAAQHSVYNIDDAVHAAAVYLKAAGAPATVADGAAANRAALAYNHSQAYASEVVGLARQYAALDGVGGAVGNIGGGAAGVVRSAAATGAVPLGSSGAVAQALTGAPASVRNSFAKSQRKAKMQAQAEQNRARGFITPPSGLAAQSPLPFGFGGNFQTGSQASGSGGAFRPRARLRASR